MTYEERMKEILEAYKNEKLDAGQVLEKIQNAGCEDLGFAKIDHARTFRQGFPEVVYCEGKTSEQNALIMEKLSQNHDNILGTRANTDIFEAGKLFFVHLIAIIYGSSKV